MGREMEPMTKDELLNRLSERTGDEAIVIQDYRLEPMNLSNMDFHSVSFTGCDLSQVIWDGVDFRGSSLRDSLFDGTSLKGANLSGCDLECCAFRTCDMSGCDISDANLFRSVLEGTNLEGVISNEGTKWFRLHCPETGPFLAYKKCVYDRIVQMLVPADAKRSSATGPTCRCNKAKVLTIKSFDYTQSFDEAWSLVDENFVYRVGQWVEVKDFNEDRWMDSTTGIHFWMTREEAKRY